MLIKSVNHFFNKRSVVHMLFWVVFVFAGSFIFSYQQNFPYQFYLVNFLIHLPLLLLYTYGVIYFFVPKFLLKRNYIVFF